MTNVNKKKVMYSRTKNLLLLAQLLGDIVAVFIGLSLAYVLRFHTWLSRVGVRVDEEFLGYGQYVPLILLGVFFFVAGLVYLKAYDPKLLLRQHWVSVIVLKTTVIWLFVFLAVSLVIKFEPPISRVFAFVAAVAVLGLMTFWRTLFVGCLRRSRVSERLVQYIVIVGWGKEAEQLVAAVTGNPMHPYEVVGYVKSAPGGSVEGCRCLGEAGELEKVLREHKNVDMVVVADAETKAGEVLAMSEVCERFYVQLKIVPSFFRVFVSNLRFQTVSGVPLLGVEELPITKFGNALMKRVVDIAGALVGLAGSAPLILAMAILIKRESPGSIFYKQVRIGRHGKPFTIYKIRSMKLDADKTGQWTQANDPRRLRVGAFMRKYNIDETPQFWNVLKGDMSLVGPRPERPEFIQRFEKEIPHYSPRHEVRPGLTGWAQVNGFRGDTSLVERVNYDLFYIENWTFWFDWQIMLMTFGPQKNSG